LAQTFIYLSSVLFKTGQAQFTVGNGKCKLLANVSKTKQNKTKQNKTKQQKKKPICLPIKNTVLHLTETT